MLVRLLVFLLQRYQLSSLLFDGYGAYILLALGMGGSDDDDDAAVKDDVFVTANAS